MHGGTQFLTDYNLIWQGVKFSHGVRHRLIVPVKNWKRGTDVL